MLDLPEYAGAKALHFGNAGGNVILVEEYTGEQFDRHQLCHAKSELSVPRYVTRLA